MVTQSLQERTLVTITTMKPLSDMLLSSSVVSSFSTCSEGSWLLQGPRRSGSDHQRYLALRRDIVVASNAAAHERQMPWWLLTLPWKMIT